MSMLCIMHGKYMYRNFEDICKAVKPLLGDCTLTASVSIKHIDYEGGISIEYDNYSAQGFGGVDTIDYTIEEIEILLKAAKKQEQIFTAYQVAKEQVNE
jgi:hypothetical protein